MVDNGSPQPVERELVERADFRGRLIRIDNASASPARAVNLGVSAARGRYIAVIPDGARLVTPRAIQAALLAQRLGPRIVATPPAWHLGPDHQSRSIREGYGPDREDELLASIDWPVDGHRLFEISSLAGANPRGFFGPLNESCFLVTTRSLWREVEGVDERFDVAGGGYVTLDLFDRLVSRTGSRRRRSGRRGVVPSGARRRVHLTRRRPRRLGESVRAAPRPTVHAPRLHAPLPWSRADAVGRALDQLSRVLLRVSRPTPPRSSACLWKSLNENAAPSRF